MFFGYLVGLMNIEKWFWILDFFLDDVYDESINDIY